VRHPIPVQIIKNRDSIGFISFFTHIPLYLLPVSLGFVINFHGNRVPVLFVDNAFSLELRLGYSMSFPDLTPFYRFV